MSKKKVKGCLIRNLADGPRDYPLSNGESIYLAAKGSASIAEELLSNALITAQRKRLIDIYDIGETETESETKPVSEEAAN